MRLTDTHIRNAKPEAKTYKLSDGGGMYLLVAADGARYWRMDYRFAEKRRTLSLGVYPTVTLADARTRREEARKLLSNGTDPGVVKKATKHAAKHASENTFETVAREWIAKQSKSLAPKYSAQILARLEADIFPQFGSRPIANIDAPELLDTLRKVEDRGVIETARRLRQTCGQVFRYAIVTRRAKHDPCVYRKLDSAILVVKATEDRLPFDGAGALNRAMERGVLVQGTMGPRLIIVGGICAQDSAQVRFTEYDHVVQALPADRANESLNVSVLPG